MLVSLSTVIMSFMTSQLNSGGHGRKTTENIHKLKLKFVVSMNSTSGKLAVSPFQSPLFPKTIIPFNHISRGDQVFQ